MSHWFGLGEWFKTHFKYYSYWWVLDNLWLERSPPSVVYYSSSFTNGLPFNNNVTSNSDFYKVVAGAIVRLINFVVRLDW